MFRSVFRPYGPVWNFLNAVTDVLGLSLLWCFCSLPLVTVGAATTALYDAAVHGIRYREEGTYRRFFRTFRAEWKTAIPAGLFWGAILLFSGFVLTLLDAAAAEDTRAGIMAGAYRVLMLLPLSGACWSAMILSRFTHGLRSLIVLSVRFIPAHLLTSLYVSVLTWIVAWYCGDNLIGLTFAPAVTVIAWSLLAERVFARYGGAVKPGADTAEA